MVAATGDPRRMTATWTFEAFQPGQLIGNDVQVADAALLERWRAIYGGVAAGAASLGVIPVLAARAYMKVTAPRPPGNIHAGQSFRLLRPPGLDESVLVSVACRDKSLRGERRIVAFDVSGEGEAGAVFDGVMTIFWAR